MKALLTILLGSIVLTGCTSTEEMSAEDRALWEKNPPSTSAPK
jgi:uncharacterized protein YcfL